MTAACAWCARPIPPSRHGKPRRFCSTAHRRAWESAARSIGEAAMTALNGGRVSIVNTSWCTSDPLVTGAMSRAVAAMETARVCAGAETPLA